MTCIVKSFILFVLGITLKGRYVAWLAIARPSALLRSSSLRSSPLHSADAKKLYHKKTVYTLPIHLLFPLLFLFASCSTGVEYSLESHGLPISLKAPRHTQVSFFDRIVLKEIHINHPEFKMQLLILDAATQPDSVFVDRQRDKISTHASFDKFKRESDQGFIYAFQKPEDSAKPTHGIRYILRNEAYIAVFKEFENQRVDLQTAKRMYSIASSARWID